MGTAWDLPEGFVYESDIATPDPSTEKAAPAWALPEGFVYESELKAKAPAPTATATTPETETGPGFTDYLKEIGGQLYSGGAGTVASALKGVGAADVVPKNVIEETDRDLRRVKDMTDEEFGAFRSKIIKKLGVKSLPVQAAAFGLRKGIIKKPEELDSYKGWKDRFTTTLEKSPVFMAGEAISKHIENDVAKDPRFKDSWTRAFASGAGSAIPYFALGALSGGVGTGIGLGLGIEAQGGEAIDRARAKKATLEQVLEAARISSIIGGTEQLPMEVIFERFPLLRAIKPAWKKIIAQGATEAVQEGTQQIWQNSVAKLVYDPKADIIDWDVLKSMIVGAGVGSGLGGIHEAGKYAGERNARRKLNAEARKAGVEGTTFTGAPGTEGEAGASGGETGAGPAPGGYAPSEEEIFARMADMVGGPEVVDRYRTTPKMFDRLYQEARNAIIADAAGGVPGRAALPAPSGTGETGGTETAAPATETGTGEAEAGTPAPEGADTGKTAPAASVKADETDDEGTRTLIAAGYTRDQIADMGSIERDDAIAEARDAGVVPMPEGFELDTSGTKTKPKTVETEADIRHAETHVETKPTDAQKEAGNYKKGHIRFKGLDITIETPKGEERTNKDPNGPKWSVKVPEAYGYVKRTRGADEDQVDVYVGPKVDSDRAYVVDQLDLKTGKFDETKVILGADSAKAARDIYEKGFSDGRGAERIGAVSETDIAGLQEWLRSGDARAPYSGELASPAGEKGAGGTAEEPAATPAAEGSEPATTGKASAPEVSPAEGSVETTEKKPAAAPAPETETWRRNFIAARKEAKSRGIDIVGKTGDELIAEIEEQDRQKAVEAGKDLLGKPVKMGGEAAATAENPNLGPLFSPPKDDYAKLAILKSVREGRRQSKEPLMAPINWLIGEGLVNPVRKRGKQYLTLSPKGEELLASLEPGVEGETAAKPAEGGTEASAEPAVTPTSAPSRTTLEKGAESETEPADDESGIHTAWNRMDRSTRLAAVTKATGREPEARAGTGVHFRPWTALSDEIKGQLRPVMRDYLENGSASLYAEVTPEPHGQLPQGQETEAASEPKTTTDRDLFIRNFGGSSDVGWSTRVKGPNGKWYSLRMAGNARGFSVWKTQKTQTLDSSHFAPQGQEDWNSTQAAEAAAEHAGFSVPKPEQESETAAAEKPAASPAVATPEPQETAATETKPADLVSAFTDFLIDPANSFKTINEARRFAKEHGFEAKAGAASAKAMEEQLELALVLASRELIAKAGSPAAAYDALVSLYERQPKLGARTSKSMAEQAYSTPAPLGYLTQVLAGVGPKTEVYEPTAGNGMLLTGADPTRVLANEIDETRRANLKRQGFQRVTGHRLPGVQPGAVGAEEAVDVVVMNPPFGPVKGEDGRSEKFKVGKLTTTQIDHAIALNALEAMPDNGRAVMIVGAIGKTIQSPEQRAAAYNAAAKRKFYWNLYNQYNVVDHFTVDGDLYAKQGAAWPVDVIVVEGRGKSSLPLPAIEPPKVLSTWDELKGKIDARPETVVSKPVGKPAGEPASREPKPVEGRGPSDRGPVEGQRPDTGRGDDQVREPVPVRDRPPDREPGSVREQQPGASYRDRLESGRKRDGGRSDLAPAAVAENEAPAAQVEYRPASTQPTLKTFVPSGMRSSAESALMAVEDERGPIDQFVADELAYDVGRLSEYFGAEQIDAIALAVHQIKRGKAFIIGDQTGTGKGRVNAALLRYAMVQGKTPVFFTENTTLYGDMVRDLNDIGIREYLGRDVNPFMTNTKESVPLDEEALDWFADDQEAKVAGEKRPPKRGKFFTSPDKEVVEEQMREIVSGGLGGYDIVFSTYTQMQTTNGQENARRNFMRNIISDAIAAFDESHNAFGGSKGEREAKDKIGGRAEVIRELTQKAYGVLFSSATYAKRPDGMDLYARTDLGDAVENIQDLGPTIEAGGVPLQQIIASMLADAGQYVRREKSFEGIEYAMETAEVAKAPYAGFSASMRAVVVAEQILKNDPAYEAWVKDLAKEGAAAAMDTAVGNAGVTSANFTSLMHNAISQFLLALKADPAADMAIAAIKAGEKPVLTVSNTNEGFIKDYVDDHNIEVGDRLDITFSEVVKNYLNRTRQVSVKKPDAEPGDKPEQRVFPLSRAGPTTRAAYEAALAEIDKIENVPISPIDYMIDKIERAGYSMGEITGRSTRVRYHADGTATFERRPPVMKEAAGKRSTLKRFNFGDLDGMLLNRSGSTGLSAHASSLFSDQKPRHMIIVQAEPNIDTHMQTLGRVNREGQVVLPRYSQLVANVPAEVRPAAILMKKMASLAANTTASRRSPLSSNAVDFMNKYGDKVVDAVLGENDQWSIIAPETDVDIARKATGRLVMLPVEEQQAFLDEVTSQYNELIENLDKMGENDLEAKYVDLKAELIERDELKAATGDSPFTQAVYMDKVSALARGQSYSATELVEKMRSTLGLSDDLTPARVIEEGVRVAGYDAMQARIKEFTAAQDAWREEQFKTAKDKGRESISKKDQAARDRFYAVSRTAIPGAVVEIDNNGEAVPAIVLEVSRSGNAKMPMALSAHRLKLALPTDAKEVSISFSNVLLEGDAAGDADAETKKTRIKRAGNQYPAKDLMEMFDAAAKTGRQERYIITGNVVSGFDLAGGRGQVVHFSDAQGNVKPGVLMNKRYNHEKFMEKRPVRFKTASQLLEFMDKVSQPEITSTDKVIDVLKVSADEIEIETPRGRKTAGKYFLAPAVRRASDDGFASVGNRMRWRGPRAQAQKVLDAMIGAGAMFQTTSDQDVAMGILKGETAAAPENANKPPLPRGSKPQTSRIPGITDRLEATKQVRNAELTNELFDKADRILPASVRLRLIDRFSGRDDVEISGAYTDFIKSVWIALSVTKDPHATLGHEAIHALRDVGLFTPAEWTILSRTSEARWSNWPGIRDHYTGYYAGQLSSPEAVEEAIIEEGVAYAFAEYFTTGEMPEAGSSGRVQAIFAKMKEFLERLRNWLAGHGFQSVEDVFERIKTGGVAARDRSATQDTGETDLDRELNAAVDEALRDRPRMMFEFENKAGEKQSVSFTPPVDMTAQAWSERSRPLLVRTANATWSFLSDPSANSTGIRRVLQDRFIDWKKYQQAIEENDGRALAESLDAYMAESLYYGRAGQRLDDFRNDKALPLIKEISDRGLTYEQVNDYLYARHAPERNAYIASINDKFPDGGSGMTNQEAFDVIERFGDKGKLEDLAAVETMAQEILDDARKTLLSGGLISRETYDQWAEQYEAYVPLRGWDQDPEVDTDPVHMNAGRRFDIRGKEAHPAYGRRTKADSPLAYIFGQAQQAILRSEKNRVGKTVLRLVQQNPNPKIWEINKQEKTRRLNKLTGMVEEVADRNHKLDDNVFSVKVGGVEHYITFHDPNLALAVKGMGTEQMNAFFKTLATLNRYLAYMNTALNPEFLISNFTRDLQTALIHLSNEDKKGLRTAVVRDLRKALAGSWRGLAGQEDTEWSRHFREYADAGGKITFFGLQDIETIKKRMDADFRNLDPSKPRQMAKAFLAVKDGVDRANQSVENAIRLSTYVNLRRAGVSKAKAASAARELTVNFNRKGTAGLAINALYLFANASIQGSMRMVQAMKGKRARRIAFAIVLFGALMDMLNRWLADDDDDGKNLYDKIPYYVKERNFILMLPGGKGEFLKFPLPYGYNVMQAFGQQVSAAMWGAEDTLKAATNIVTTAMNSFNPIGGGPTIWHQISPTFTDPAIDLLSNQNWFGGPIYPHVYDPRRPPPDSQLYFNSAREPSKWITKKINEAFGGNTVRSSGPMDISPETLDHMFDFFAGGAGMFWGRVTDLPMKMLAGEEIETKDIPFLRKVYGEKAKYWDKSLYYEISDSVLLVEKEVKTFRQAGDHEKSREVAKTYGTEYRMISLVKAAENKLRQLRKHRNAAKALTDPENRRKQLDRIEDAMRRVQLKVRRRYYDLDRQRRAAE